MGYISHHAIVLSAWDEAQIRRAHAKAEEVFKGTACWVSPLSPPAVNSERGFYVAPDGSKEGWSESDAGDAARAEFIAWMRNEKDFWVDWALVQFGNDDHITRIVDHSDVVEDEDVDPLGRSQDTA